MHHRGSVRLDSDLRSSRRRGGAHLFGPAGRRGNWSRGHPGIPTAGPGCLDKRAEENTFPSNSGPLRRELAASTTCTAERREGISVRMRESRFAGGKIAPRATTFLISGERRRLSQRQRRDLRVSSTRWSASGLRNVTRTILLLASGNVARAPTLSPAESGHTRVRHLGASTSSQKALSNIQCTSLSKLLAQTCVFI